MEQVETLSIDDILNSLNNKQLKQMNSLYGLKYTSKFKKGDLINQLLALGDKLDINLFINILQIDTQKLLKKKNKRNKLAKVKKEKQPRKKSVNEQLDDMESRFITIGEE